jgi:hypothetical protein
MGTATGVNAQVATDVSEGFHVVGVVGNIDDNTALPNDGLTAASWGQLVVAQIQANPGIGLAEAGNEMFLKGGNPAGYSDAADPQLYGAMYLAAVNDMKAAGIHIPLLYNMYGTYLHADWSPSDDGDGTGWLRDAVNANKGLAAAILANGVSVHPYGPVGQSLNGCSYGTAAVACEEQDEQTLLGGIPKQYITEYGVNLASCSCTQAQEASQAQQVLTIFTSDPNVAGFWWFGSRDYGCDSSGNNCSQAFGIRNWDGSARPAFNVLSSFALAEESGSPIPTPTATATPTPTATATPTATPSPTPTPTSTPTPPNTEITLTGHTLSWNPYPDAPDYTLATVLNPTTTRNTTYVHVPCCSVTPPPVPGQTVNYGLVANNSPQDHWATEVTITWPPANTATTLALTSSTSSSQIDQAVTFTAKVNLSGATGTVEFIKNHNATNPGTVVCPTAAVVNGVATCSITFYAASVHTVYAAFTGTGGYANASVSITQTVNGLT